jgi:hypothetical protein
MGTPQRLIFSFTVLIEGKINSTEGDTNCGGIERVF